MLDFQCLQCRWWLIRLHVCIYTIVNGCMCVFHTIGLDHFGGKRQIYSECNRPPTCAYHSNGTIIYIMKWIVACHTNIFHAIDRWEKKKEWQDTYTVAWETFYPIVPTEKKRWMPNAKKNRIDIHIFPYTKVNSIEKYSIFEYNKPRTSNAESTSITFHMLDWDIDRTTGGVVMLLLEPNF